MDTDKLAFKSAVMTVINRQEFILGIDEQIECLEEIIQDIKDESKRKLEEMN